MIFNPIARTLPLVILVGCSQSELPSTNSKANSPLEAGMKEIRSDASCKSQFSSTPAALKVTFRGMDNTGAAADYGFVHKIDRVNGDIAHVTETMLVGRELRPGPTMPFSRQDAVITLSSGGQGSERVTTYGALSRPTLQAMRPGQTVETSALERSSFVPGGPGEARGRLRITFVGCSSLSISGRTEPVKVFDVMSIARAVVPPAAPGGPKDKTVDVRNRYWVSERLGWPLREQTSAGAIQAASIEERK